MSRENQTGDDDRKQLNAELESLRQEVSRLQHENRDLELALLTTTEHGDFVEAELDQLNRQLQAEINERQLAQAKLQSILDMLWRDKNDLEIMLVTATEHGDTIEYELYKQVVDSVEQLQEQARQSELQVEERTAELKQTSAELSGLFAAMTDVIVVYDRRGQCIKVAPTTPHLLLNPPPEKIVEVYETLSLQLGDRQISCIHQVLASQQTQNLEYSVAIDGQEVWFSANVSPLSEDTVIWVARDISDRKQSELDLHRAKEEAERASRQRGEFLASMSHELRTPLNAIMGFAQLMAYDESIGEDHQESLSIISQSGEHLLTLINDILEMSKLESGKVPLHKRVLDLFKLLHTLREMLMLKASSKGLDLIFELNPDVPQCIYTDEGKLRQVLINLLSNAIKFTQTGSVTLRVSLVSPEEISEEVPKTKSLQGDAPEKAKVDAPSPEGKIELLNQPALSSLLVRFEIEDTGEGIALEEMPKLFEPFVQSASGHRSKEGTGLGLAISRQLVRLLGGDITLTSTVNVGTTFCFCIQGVVACETSIEEDIYAKEPKIETLDAKLSQLKRSSLLLTRSDLLVMPNDWIAQLYTATIRVDASQILQLIDKIPSQQQFLANMLLELLNEFRFDIIFEATSKILEESETA
ncbi:ATP-binding protein [Tumidithrix elongata RA019]|uniref:histidine kinase n=1 Tax=Tumidithrix elongata BACA0141 TaxID=2716417 RepID=A0AAW9PUK8_9CYAN|nr:ATP-binding protein [Tumidithrix elongata RA019]